MADATIEYLLRIRDEASQALKDLGDEAGEAESKLQGADKGTQSMTASMVKATAVIGAAKMAFGALKTAFTEVGINSVKVGAQMESYETKLTVLTGSADVAKARLEELFRIGSTTPFELDSLIEAEVNLRALGVNAEETLPLVMDFAGAMGVDLASAAVEVGRAMQFGAGAVETISGRALRAQVELRTGSDALKMSTEEFRTELIKTLTDSEGIFAGGTEKLAATFTGMVSNLSDAWFKFQKEISEAGLFEAAQDTLVLILDTLGDNAEVTSQWAKIIGGSLAQGMLLFVEMLAKGGTFGAALAEVLISAAQGWLILLKQIPAFQDSAISGLITLAGWKELVKDTGVAFATVDDEIDGIQEKLENMPTITVGPTAGKATDVGEVVVASAAAGGAGTSEADALITEDPKASAALQQVINNTAGLIEGTIPGNTWWAAAINLLAKIGDEGFDMDWNKLGDTVHDAFVGVVKLHLSHDQLHAVIVDAVFFGVRDALTFWRSETEQPGEQAQPEAFRLINEALGTEAERSFQIGTKFVDKTGIALLHRGEQVVPANGAMPSNMQGFGGGGGLVVNVNAPLGIGPGTAEQLVRELNSILGARGLNLAVT